ncbi:hypothetical protein B7463_g11708, partial [Scytalidium lignicola]
MSAFQDHARGASNLGCTVSWTRASKELLDEIMERELRSLKEEFAKSPDRGAAQLSPPPSDTPIEVRTEYTTPTIISPGSQQPMISARVLDNIWIGPQVIHELLEEYYTHYHVLFPILPELPAFLESYASFDVLFWTVIAIACGGLSEHSDLYIRLKNPVERLLTDINHPASHSFPQIQALLLICSWPFPFGPIDTDPSWTYCGLATHYALRLGLHRPAHTADFRYDTVYDQETMMARQKAWIACFIINQGISTKLGIPSTVRVDNSILGTLTSLPSWLPEVLCRQLFIAYQVNRFTITLGNHEKTSTGLFPEPTPMIRMFDKDLRMAETRFESTSPPMELAMLLGARLSLYSFVFGAEDSGENSPLDTINTNNEILSQAYITIMQLLKVAVSPDAGIIYWTALCRGHIYFSVFFLLKLIKYPTYSFVDEIAARNIINQAWERLKSCSAGEGDHLSRICAIIQFLGTGSESQVRGGPLLVVKSRMSANIYRDAVWRAKKRFSGIVQDQHPEDYTTAESLLQNGPMELFSTPYLEGILPDLGFLSGNFE